MVKSRLQQSVSEADEESLPTDFEAALSELESIVQAMESDGLSLEASLAAYQRGTRLATQCRRLLAEVQNRVRVLEAELLQPLEPDGGAS
jgi:exodeoxyribonuclease VII small subunit